MDSFASLLPNASPPPSCPSTTTMLLPLFFYLFLFPSLASAQISIQPFRRPPSLCTPLRVSWSGGIPPFEVKLFDGINIVGTIASLDLDRSSSWTPLFVHPEESLYLTIYDGSRTTIARSGRFAIREVEKWEVVNGTCRLADQVERSSSRSAASIASVYAANAASRARTSERLPLGLLVFFSLLGAFILLGLPFCVWYRRRRARIASQSKNRLVSYEEVVEFDLWGTGEDASRHRDGPSICTLASLRYSQTYPLMFSYLDHPLHSPSSLSSASFEDGFSSHSTSSPGSPSPLFLQPDLLPPSSEVPSYSDALKAARAMRSPSTTRPSGRERGDQMRAGSDASSSSSSQPLPPPYQFDS